VEYSNLTSETKIEMILLLKMSLANFVLSRWAFKRDISCAQTH